MSKPKILISQIKNVCDIKLRNLKGIESCKKKIFGYVENMPGEKNWLKPLVGKSMQNYYFPSKYLHLDFNLKEYLRMQTVRFKKKETDESLLKLQKCINMIIENKDIIDKFLCKIPKELFIENQSLKDFYELYLTIYPSHIYKPNLLFDIKELNLEKERFSWFFYNKKNDGEEKIIINDSKNNHILNHNEGNKINKNNMELGNEEKNQDKDNTKNNHMQNENFSNYENIIFNKTKKKIKFKKIICMDQINKETNKNNTSLINNIMSNDDNIYYLDNDLNVGLEKTITNDNKTNEEIEKTKNEFYNLLNENESLKKTLSIRNRFIDPLYLRRRYSYIDKLTKKKIKKEKHKTYRKHFIQHADEKKVWPDNKGLLNKIYPNPYS
ncbi:conserved protein, unknown function [Plasmodium sp. gorilla clade G2]|uniref:conserved protein, unknown function n=1 Tax=Plasmodium sp. gorilla clade G2 TaxID=880535 RepID=UPI000D2033E6|nr:conserved protein, unknown function [Plasmodium sp. gorilla clade G2]SOV17067.1 conserved protein, unknown function [Plasmodium sp. gorilla clade G2]